MEADSIRLVRGRDLSHVMDMKKRLPIAMVCLPILLLTGCLEFEQQRMSFRHDTATDTLYIYQEYRGIFGADDPSGLSEGEKEQMASVMREERTFFFNNWITEYNRSLFKEKQGAPKGSLDTNEAYEASMRVFLDLALANVKVENVGFYLDGEKRLCGAQRVTVKNVSKVLVGLNHMLWYFAWNQAEEKDKTKEERRLLIAFADSGQETVRLEGNRLEIRWPLTEADYRKLKEETPQSRAFRESGGELGYTNGMAVFALGKPESKSVSLALPFSDKPYSTNGLAEARKYGVRGTFDAGASAKAFLEDATGKAGRGK